jgi:1,4-dihydroxy-6-naphthoate synthase
MIPKLTFGYSPCPNDTFSFYALTHDKLTDLPFSVRERLEDVETLNQLALSGTLDLTKTSYHALGHLREQYALLRSGGALGRGCGPLVVATQPTDMAALRGKTVAIPGELTTANLLLQLYSDGFDQLLILPFDQIMPALKAGEAEAGVIIHESRFTYQNQNFHEILDLGAWWEETTGLPIPLGGILARRDLGQELINSVETAIRASLDYAWKHPEQTRSYIRQHAQELDDAVTDRHINLYVTPFSRDLGTEGVLAVETLFAQAEKRGIIPACNLDLFAT